MTYIDFTNFDEEEFQKRIDDLQKEKDEQDLEKYHAAKMGLSQKCPECGSHKYSYGAYHEKCDECGLSQGY